MKLFSGITDLPKIVGFRQHSNSDSNSDPSLAVIIISSISLVPITINQFIRLDHTASVSCVKALRHYANPIQVTLSQTDLAK